RRLPKRGATCYESTLDKQPLRVLYIHMVGAFGGASRSLFEVVRAFPPGAVQPMFVTQQGSVKTFFSQLGAVVESKGLSQFDNTRYSHYRGTRWVVLLRELAYLPLTAFALRRARRRWGTVDLIHLNEFTGLIPLWIARRLFQAPSVVHVRSLAYNEPRSARTRWIDRLLRKADAVIAIDENVRESLPADLGVQVIHNVFSPAGVTDPDESFERRLSTLRPESFKVGFVGNLMRVKGIYELIEAARMTVERGLDVEFIIVGDDPHPSSSVKGRLLKLLGLDQSARQEIEAALDQHGLRGRVHLVGFTSDIAHAYRRMDVLCFPSHYDAPGRPIFEAAFFGVPSIVALRHPRSDTLVDGETGLAIEPRDARGLAAAIERLASDPASARRMGDAARQLAHENCDAGRNAMQLLGVYRRIARRS
ncbi:MAG: glycosyltransferase family 4 protein, partial [Rhodoglobus sp.]